VISIARNSTRRVSPGGFFRAREERFSRLKRTHRETRGFPAIRGPGINQEWRISAIFGRSGGIALSIAAMTIL